MSEDSTPTLSIIALLHAPLLHNTEAGVCGNDAPIIWEIKQAIHEDLAKRYTSVVEKNIFLTASTRLLSSPKRNKKTYAPRLLLRLPHLSRGSWMTILSSQMAQTKIEMALLAKLAKHDL